MINNVMGNTCSLIRRLVRRMPGRPAGMPVKFSTSQSYWNERYEIGGNSGQGSYGRLARFKAEVLNEFVISKEIRSVVEFGCGDGAQLALARYPAYIGIDVSPLVIEKCRKKFVNYENYQFFVSDDPDKPWQKILTRNEYGGADLTLSLDVIYHLVEDDVFDQYMRDLFALARRYVIVYSSNNEAQPPAAHVRHRCFTAWVDRHAPGWQLEERIDNRFPSGIDAGETSFADFYIFTKKARF